jgi:hypothetical protein
VSATTLPLGIGNRQRTSYMTVANNQLGSADSNIQWLAASAPQNGQYAEGVENFIWEDNEFRYGANYANVDIYWVGRNMIDRGNRNVTGNRPAIVATGANALSADWIGPYFPGQPSMRSRFGSATVRPNPPSTLQIQ